MEKFWKSSKFVSFFAKIFESLGMSESRWLFLRFCLKVARVAGFF
jgi:hypothetical protein